MRAAAAILCYEFRDEDLLEEALESGGSGVRVVGRSKRVCERGNRELETVGEAVMGLVLRDQCYLLRIPGGEFLRVLASLLLLPLLVVLYSLLLLLL